MSSEIKYLLAQASGLPALVNLINRNRLLVLAYHGLYDGPRRGGLMPDTFVHVDDVVMQLKFLRRKYHIITPDDLVAFIEKGRPLSAHAALITFDDGYESFYRLGEPVLRSMGIQALVFIPSRYLEHYEPFWFDLMWFFMKHADADKITWLSDALNLNYTKKYQSTFSDLCLNRMKGMPVKSRDEIITEIKQLTSLESEKHSTTFRLFYPMSEKQLRELSSQGTTLGGHTHTHTILSVLSEDQAEKEIIFNKKLLESTTGKQCSFFAYPNGAAKDFNKLHKDMLKRTGYLAAFSLTQERSSIQEDTMNISRIHVAPEDTVKSLQLRCTGFLAALRRNRTDRVVGL